MNPTVREQEWGKPFLMAINTSIVPFPDPSYRFGEVVRTQQGYGVVTGMTLGKDPEDQPEWVYTIRLINPDRSLSSYTGTEWESDINNWNALHPA